MIISIYIIARCRQGQPVKETLMSQSQCHVFMFLQVLKVKQSYLSVGHLGQRNSIRCWAIYYQRWLHIADPISIELIDVRVNFLIWWISRLIGIWCSGPVFSYHIMKYFHAAYKNYYCFTVFSGDQSTVLHSLSERLDVEACNGIIKNSLSLNFLKQDIMFCCHL